MRYSLIILLTFCFSAAMAQSPKIEFSTKNGTDEEKAVITKVQALLDEHDLTKWVFTDKVLIEARVIPHSHPILTLNTRPQTQDELLSTFLHEQIHWYGVEKDNEVNKAIAELRTMYKNVPVGRPDGARDEHSTYLHLIVCYLEYKSLGSLVGEARSKKVMEDSNHYKWIYHTVLTETDKLEKVIRKHGLDLLNQ